MSTLLFVTAKIHAEIGKPATIEIQSTEGSGNKITFDYDEKKYPGGYNYQARDILISKGNIFTTMGFDNVNNRNWLVFQNEV